MIRYCPELTIASSILSFVPKFHFIVPPNNLDSGESSNFGYFKALFGCYSHQSTCVEVD